MKSFLKPIITSTVLSIVGLCFTISHAANEQPTNLNNQKVVENHLYAYAFPLLESEGNHSQLIVSNSIINDIELLPGGSNSIGGLLNPMLIIPNNIIPRSLSNKDESYSFFEMTAVFNDKLQSFIASFHHSSEVDITDELAISSSILTSNCKN
ncbi:MAG: hypothetical protein MJK12_09145 [Colwellia sp.]|nr:hypothetical protein [Colwellia sp.]